MNWLRIGDALISFSVRHLLRINVADVVMLVYLRTYIGLLRENVESFHKQLIQKSQR